MKWNEIKKHFAQVNKTSDTVVVKTTDQDVLLTPKVKNNKKIDTAVRIVFLITILVIIALGILVIVRLVKKGSDKPVLPRQDIQKITTFLDTNPPAPLTNSDTKTIQGVLNKPVMLNSADVESINNFLNK
jgi:hypothetical protein